MQLRAEGVSYSAGGRAVFKEVSFHWHSPMTVALVGPSGAGKTSLLNAIAGHIKLSGGNIHRDGAEQSPAWVLQHSPLLLQRSALENAQLGALLTGVSRTESLSRATEALEMVRVNALAHRQAKFLSGGERQRVSVARAIAARAPLILADEPTASLDREAKMRVASALLQAAAAGALVVIATHDSDVASMADETIRLG